MATVGIVSEGELVIGGPRADGVGLLPEFLGLGGVVLQVIGALEGIAVAWSQRRLAGVPVPLSTFSQMLLRLMAMEMA